MVATPSLAVMHAKEVLSMDKYRFIGGIVLMVLAASLFFFAETPVAVPIGLLVVGIALVAVSRRKAR
jgi:hypothetical protein